MDKHKPEYHQDQAALLIEALPYMRQYNGCDIVIKYGGHAMSDKNNGDVDSAMRFAHDIVLLKQCGLRPIIVHGGGPQIADMLDRLNIKTHFVDGLRYSDADTVEIAEMVLSGKINKQIVTNISLAGGHAIGISGKDGGLIIARKIANTPADLGFVGTPSYINVGIIRKLVESDLIPIIAPIGVGENGESYNINADTVAGAIAGALQAKRLILLTDVEGILDKNKQLIKELSLAQIAQLRDDNIIKGGMIPKTETCINAINEGVEASVILDGRRPHAVVLELFTALGAGTLITGNNIS